MKKILHPLIIFLFVLFSTKANGQACSALFNGISVDTCTINKAVPAIAKTETDVDDIAKFIQSTCTTDQEKVYFMYTWIAGQFKYDLSRLELIEKGKVKRELYVNELLKKRKGVCGDFANLFETLCDSLGIPCFRVSGYTKTLRLFNPIRKNHYDHAWNVVRINGTWYPIDVTWGVRQYSEKKYNKKKINYAYLFADEKEFTRRHLAGDPLFQVWDQQITYKTFRWHKNVGKEEVYATVQADTLLNKRYALSKKERALEALKSQVLFEPKSQKTAVARYRDKIEMFVDKKNPANKKLTKANYDEAIEWYKELQNFAPNLTRHYRKKITRYSSYRISELQKKRDKLKN